MINISRDQITQKIAEDKGISQEEVKKKIDSKLEELSGLISEEGAAHIVANEYGVDLMKQEGLSKIEKLVAGMKSVSLNAKVLRTYEIRTFEKSEGQGKVSRALVGDETGVTMLVLWDENASLLEKIKEDDVLSIKNVDVRENRGFTEIHASKNSVFDVNPEGVNVEVKKSSSEVKQKKISELTEEDTNAEVFVTIVQVFDPKFFQMKDGTEGAVLNLFVDDGSDNIRCVLWKEQILSLLNTNEEELKKYKDNLEGFEEVKTDLLGKMVKFRGRVQKNKMFERLELVVYGMKLDVDPEEEMKSLEEDSEKSSSDEETQEVQEQAREETQEPEQTESSTEKKKDVSSDEELDEEVMSLDDLDDL